MYFDRHRTQGSEYAGVILAAGMGRRMGLKHSHKILLNVAGLTLLENHLKGMYLLGIKEVVLVVGYNYRLVTEKASKIAEKLGNNLQLNIVQNKEYKTKENGYSAYLGLKEAISPYAIVVMGDHLLPYRHNILEQSMKEFEKSECAMAEVVDPYMVYMRPEWSTKVEVKNGKVLASSKTLEKFNALDTGLFFVDTKYTLSILEENAQEEKYNWNDAVLKSIETSCVEGYIPAAPYPWFGLNTPEEVKNAERWLQIPEVRKYFPAAFSGRNGS